jgi:hypothetical protein
MEKYDEEIAAINASMSSLRKRGHILYMAADRHLLYS